MTGTNKSNDRLVILLATGPEDRGNRATLAFAMGVSALISGVDVVIYCTISGTFWSRAKASERVHIGGFEPLAVYVDQFLEAGGRVLVCSPCDAFYCSIAAEGALIQGAERSGLAHVVDLSMGATMVTL